MHAHYLPYFILLFKKNRLNKHMKNLYLLREETKKQSKIKSSRKRLIQIKMLKLSKFSTCSIQKYLLLLRFVNCLQWLKFSIIIKFLFQKKYN